MSPNLFGIFIKYPEPGKVKTRLARDVGKEKAAEVCKHLVEKAMHTTRPSGNDFDRVIFYDPPDRLRDFARWFPGEHFIQQRGRDVGERMDNAIRDLLNRGAKKAVVTGADIPDLTAVIILEAFAVLDHADVAIGPATDGGYYLIGMKAPHPEIFRDIIWSTDTVLEESISRIRQSGWTCRAVQTLSDIDTLEDYHRCLKADR